MDMKKLVAMMVAALMSLSFSMVAVAVEKKPVMKNASSAKKAAKKDANKGEKTKDDAAKPAKKGKKEVSGC
jgi:hypothetical protein